MITVKNNNVQVSARKVRQVCDLVRNKKVEEALKILRFNEKREISICLTKLINSGLSIATESKKFDLDNLVIGTLKVDEGPILKRIMPRAQGRAYRIHKKSSYITLSLKEK
jgi:large subunit ribosomal protein L22